MGRSRMRGMAWAWLVAGWGTLAAGADVPPKPGLESVADRLGTLIQAAMEAQNLPAVSVALVRGTETVWARGFGTSRPPKVSADADMVGRAGSVSKLFTDLAAIRLVEAGKLDLDLPVSNYLPDFAPRNPFGLPITLRQLMAHRSGLVRESPVGHYFDPTVPSLADTVRSLNATELVYKPGTRTKYSNAGVSVVGRVIEAVTGEPFAPYVQREVIDRLGLTSTAFVPTPAMLDRSATGEMWTYDGRTFPAPTFPLGTAPAGNLYSTAPDLARFIAALIDGGRGVVRPETLRSMWAPQFAEPGAKAGFGLGFNVSEFDGHRRVGHNGAIYGFATEVSALPDDGLGVVVLISKDCANATGTRIADSALRMMLALKAGKPLPEVETTRPVPVDLARRLDGRYAKGDASIELAERAGRLSSLRGKGGFRVDIRALDATHLIADGPLGYGLKGEIGPDAKSITLDGTTFERAEVPRPAPAPAKWLGLIGEYGWDHNTLYILEREGRLHALIEWFFYDQLDEASPDLFKFPERSGLYHGESLAFHRDPATGRADRVVAAGVTFLRRPIDGDDGSTYKIKPVRPVAELRPEALAATPPAERGEFRTPDLVDLTTLDPAIKLDVRYATTNNFVGVPFYSSARAFAQRPAAESLAKAHAALKAQGYGLLIHDAYRPWHVTRMFWDATPESGRGFVANPATGSKHNRGCAIDLSLYELATGRPVEMVGGYDEFSTRSSPDYPGGTSLQRWHRELLRKAMESNGFTVNEVEWWHFDYKDWRSYPILNETFEMIGKRTG